MSHTYHEREINRIVGDLLSAAYALEDLDLNKIADTVSVAIDQCNNHAVGRDKN